MSATPLSTSQAQPNVIEWLLQTDVPINGEEQQRRARLLSALFLVVIIVGALIVTSVVIQNPAGATDSDTTMSAVGIVLLAVLYVVNRRGHTNAAAAGMIVLTALVFTIVPFMPGSASSFVAYAIVPVLLTGLFFSLRHSLMVAVVIIVSAGILNSIPTLYDKGISNILYFLMFASALLATFIWHFNAVEAIRRRALETAITGLRESEAKLEQRVKERTAELEAKNAELEQAWEAAKQADQVKSQFLASMSHELRTPLNAILNFTEFVNLGMLGPVTEKQQDALGKSLDSGRHLLSLINDVLDMTKIEAGMMKLFIEDNVDLKQELTSVIGAGQTLLQDKPVQLIQDIDSDLPKLIGDKRRIRQILLNLLSNAIKFTDAGSVTLSVKNRGDEMMFAVTDTGPGIAPEDQDVIFQPFRQTEHGIQHAGGTGLGLPITRRLVEAHGGRIWLESKPGEGSAFFVTLPVRSAELLQMI